MANSRNRIAQPPTESPGDSLELSSPLPRSRRRFPTFTVTVVVALLLLVALAPTLVSLTSIGPGMVSSAARDRLQGSLEVRSVSVGWIAPVTLRGLTIKDPVGNVIGTVDSVVVGKSLLGLLMNSNNLGIITIEKPQLLVEARPNGSNLEDLFAPLMSQPSTGAASPVVTVDVRNGLIKLVDAGTQESWEVAPLAMHLESPRGDQNAWKVALQAKVGDASAVGEVDYIAGEAGGTRLALDTEHFPLAPLQPIMARVVGPVRLTGALSGKIGAELSDAGRRQKVEFAGVDGRAVALAAPQYLGADTLRLEQLKADGTAELVEGVWQLRNLQIASDVAAISGSGDVRVSDFASAQLTSTGGVAQSDCDIHGQADLAKLMKMLPSTLRVREGVVLTSGTATMSLVSQPVAAGRRFAASLATQNVRANNNGQIVELREPLQFTAAVLQTNQGWQIENLDAKSSFLTAQIQGTAAEGRLTLRGDMNKLAAELDQFVDLGDMRLAGQINGNVTWSPAMGGTMDANGDLHFTSFEMVAPGVMPWKEDDLAVTFDANGIALGSPAYGVAGGKLEVASASDRLDIVLLQGVRSISDSSPVPLEVKLNGNLATWLPRLQAFLPLSGVQASGPIAFGAKANVSLSRCDVPNAVLRCQQLRFDGYGMHVSEPELKGDMQFSYDMAAGRLTNPSLLLQGTAAALSTTNLIVETGANAKITGEIAARGDMGKVLGWFSDPRAAAGSQFYGEGEAEATFALEGGVTKAILKGQVVNLAYASPEIQPVSGGRIPAREVALASNLKTVWEEPLITFNGSASYDSVKDIVSLTNMKAAAGTSAVTATGTISQIASLCQLDLAGDMQYDLASWTPKVRPLLGGTFDMSGSGVKAFEIHGPLLEPTVSTRPGEAPLVPLALTGKAGLGWQGAEWMALEVGPSEVFAELKDSTIFVQPTKIPLSQGTLQMSPAIVLRGSNWYVAQQQARVIDHVVITPEMCSVWIKFVAPLLADATQSQGKFSVDIDKAIVPINQPTLLDTQGKFVVHNVTVGPGPLATQLIGVAQQVKSFIDGGIGLEGLAGLATGGATGTPAATAKQWVELPEQEIPVEVAEGRVHHQGLTMTVKDLTLRTSGSVGINDQSLQLTCEVPIREEWLQGKSYLAGLKGQSITIPVGGTISRPQLDTRNLVSFGRNLAFSAGRGAVQGQLQGGLDKGTGAVQGQLQQGQAKVQDELNKGKQKVEDELRNGLKGIFGS